MKKSKSSFFISLGMMIFIASMIAYGFYIDSISYTKFASPTNMAGVAAFIISLIAFAILALSGLILAFFLRKKNPSATQGLILGTLSTVVIFFVYLNMFK